MNGLAVDTMRLRLAAGAVAYVYAYIGFTLAQQQLAAVCRRIENDALTVDADGNVSSGTVPFADDNGPGTTSAKVQAYQRDIGMVLRFATTTVDENAARTLNTSHEPPVTALTNRPGLLEKARQDHADATADAQGAAASLSALPHDAATQLPAAEPDDLPTPSVHVPPGASATTAIGAHLLAAGLTHDRGGRSRRPDPGRRLRRQLRSRRRRRSDRRSRSSRRGRHPRGGRRHRFGRHPHHDGPGQPTEVPGLPPPAGKKSRPPDQTELWTTARAQGVGRAVRQEDQEACS